MVKWANDSDPLQIHEYTRIHGSLGWISYGLKDPTIDRAMAEMKLFFHNSKLGKVKLGLGGHLKGPPLRETRENDSCPWWLYVSARCTDT